MNVLRASMATNLLLTEQVEALTISCDSALHHSALLFKRMIAAGLCSQVAEHLEGFKALLDQQRRLEEALKKDLGACESFTGG